MSLDLSNALFRWFYWYPLRLFIQNLPLKVSAHIAVRLGAAYFYLMNGMRARVVEGIRISFKSKDQEELAEIAKKTFIEKALSSIETFYYPSLSTKNIADIISYEGLEHLDGALKMGKGAILCHAHFGNEELLMPAIGYKGYRVNQIASRWAPEKIVGLGGFISNYINQKACDRRIGTREAFPVVFHYVDKSLRSVYRCLENNEFLLIAADGREGAKWTKADFLGRQAFFATGAFQIAQKTGAPVLPVFLLRKQGFSHRLIVEKPLRTGESAETGMKSFLKILESYVERYPYQYAKVYWLEPSIFADSEPARHCRYNEMPTAYEDSGK